MNLEELFKQICLEEANDLNKFWNNSHIRLAELEIEYEDEKIKERTRELRRIKLCEDIDNILKHNCYIGDYSDVIEYFERTHLPLSSVNCYFEIQPELKGLYNLLPKHSDRLGLLQNESDKLKNKMYKLSYINEEMLYNSILKAFQEIFPKRNTKYDIMLPRFYESYEIFPWTREVKEEFVYYDLINLYKKNINEYMRIHVKDLKIYKMKTIFN